MGSVPGSGRSPEVGNANPLQYSCLENSMDRGAWWSTVHEVAESDTTEWLSMPHTHIFVGEKSVQVLCPFGIRCPLLSFRSSLVRLFSSILLVAVLLW